MTYLDQSGHERPRMGAPSKFQRTRNYFNGVRISKGVIHVRATGQQIPIDWKLLRSVIAVLRMYIYLFGVKFFRWLRRAKPTENIAFYPEQPAFWYNIWIDVQISGLHLCEDTKDADIVFVFDDTTTTNVDLSQLGSDKLLINHRVTNVAKKHVGAVFSDVFGYDIAIDPLKFKGKGIRKSDENGTHDGKVLEFPIHEDKVVENFAYQRLVDTINEAGICEEFRVAYVFGRIAVVYHKFKAIERRFGTEYLDVKLKSGDDVFSQREVELLVEFCEQMGLDFGALDVMRDKHSKRIYVVDVNKTCMPVLSLKFADQMNAHRRICVALLKGLDERMSYSKSELAVRKSATLSVVHPLTEN